MTPLIFLVAMAASVGAMPATDPHKICQDARAAALSEDQTSAYDSCIHDEQAARDQLKQNWSHFSADARATCSEPEAVSVSYVEVLTCMEMESGKNFSGGTPPQAPAGSPPPKPGAPAKP